VTFSPHVLVAVTSADWRMVITKVRHFHEKCLLIQVLKILVQHIFDTGCYNWTVRTQSGETTSVFIGQPQDIKNVPSFSNKFNPFHNDNLLS
jgi:hypothetical protein